jgi:hypothetical protein
MKYKDETVEAMVAYITKIVAWGSVNGVNKGWALEGLGILNNLAIEKNDQIAWVGNYQVKLSEQENISRLLHNGQKISAIVALRAALVIHKADGNCQNIGIKEAKEAVETFAEKINLPNMGR